MGVGVLGRGEMTIGFPPSVDPHLSCPVDEGRPRGGVDAPPTPGAGTETGRGPILFRTHRALKGPPTFSTLPTLVARKQKLSSVGLSEGPLVFSG